MPKSIEQLLREDTSIFKDREEDSEENPLLALPKTIRRLKKLLTGKEKPKRKKKEKNEE